MVDNTLIGLLNSETGVSPELETAIRELILEQKRLEGKVRRAEGALMLHVQARVADGLESLTISHDESKSGDLEYVDEVVAGIREKIAQGRQR